jgi:spore maturation protein CgeB
MVTVDCRGAWYRPTAHLDDVVVSLQGRGRYLPSTGQINVLWMMSHPEETSFDELTNFDVVFGASRRWLDRARMYTRQEPEMLLQCTDPRRFHLGDVDPARRHEILMVGNARGDGPRAAVKAALDAGLVPSVYGQRWKGFVPAGTIKGTYLPNEQLSSYYASAGAVLNDHWEDMKDWGIISNRLFDLAACGARVVSDEVEGLDEVFGGLIATYGDSDELRAQVERLQSEGPEDARRRVQLAEHVRTAHSFAARAATISDRVLGVLRETGSDPRLIGSAADRG